MKYLNLLFLLNIIINSNCSEINSSVDRFYIQAVKMTKHMNSDAEDINPNIEPMKKLLELKIDGNQSFKELYKSYYMCIEMIKNKNLHHELRVHARIYAGIIQMALIETDYEFREYYIIAMRETFVKALALARKSNDLKDLQEKLITSSYNAFAFHEYKEYYKEITKSEIDEMEKMLKIKPVKFLA